MSGLLPSPAASPPPARPRLRGVVHKWAFLASLPLGAALVVASAGHGATLATTIYVSTVSGLLGVSALYHRVTWSVGARRRMRLLDHSMIFVIIAGSYTPWALVVLDSSLAETILLVVWGGALVGVLVRLAWTEAPKWFVALPYVVVGSVTVTVLPGLLERVGAAGTGLLVLAGALSLVGAGVYTFRRPDPAPTVFGYHEVFHLLVVVALAAHSLAVALYVVPGDLS